MVCRSSPPALQVDRGICVARITYGGLAARHQTRVWEGEGSLDRLIASTQLAHPPRSTLGRSGPCPPAQRSAGGEGRAGRRPGVTEAHLVKRVGRDSVAREGERESVCVCAGWSAAIQSMPPGVLRRASARGSFFLGLLLSWEEDEKAASRRVASSPVQTRHGYGRGGGSAPAAEAAFGCRYMRRRGCQVRRMYIQVLHIRLRTCYIERSGSTIRCRTPRRPKASRRRASGAAAPAPSHHMQPSTYLPTLIHPSVHPAGEPPPRICTYRAYRPCSLARGRAE
ncbi:hypothetical protein BDY21DRAFT_871 [Lineolata rhizophorae]|uniref:Uncharacterized protein n=1 Tax=Lineolata rhizophorae TaxID=578093 RepID=A0A6A6PCT4_9PEZI|nr:hypothetical protein BDY21DRAFT_871 [Lineolata rhizophorae]